MLISKKTEYALKALVALAAASKAPAVQSLRLQQLSEREEIPAKFLEHIMAVLKKGGILNSQKGRGGGYTLSRPASHILLGDVIRLLDGPLSPLGTGKDRDMETAIRKGKRASGIYSILLEVRTAISSVVDRLTLEDLYLRTQELAGSQSSRGMYYI